jgi:hypothetical protein
MRPLAEQHRDVLVLIQISSERVAKDLRRVLRRGVRGLDADPHRVRVINGPEILRQRPRERLTIDGWNRRALHLAWFEYPESRHVLRMEVTPHDIGTGLARGKEHFVDAPLWRHVRMHFASGWTNAGRRRRAPGHERPAVMGVVILARPIVLGDLQPRDVTWSEAHDSVVMFHGPPVAHDQLHRPARRNEDGRRLNLCIRDRNVDGEVQSALVGRHSMRNVFRVIHAAGLRSDTNAVQRQHAEHCHG